MAPQSACHANHEPLRPSDLADPDPGNLDSLAERGRGLYLIHRLMDAVGRS